eukprot:COSAG01_NODE_3682_length_5801_cov_5.442301_2_plen_85_part_00
MRRWLVNLCGAPGTLYDGERFTLQFVFGDDYVRALRPASTPLSCSSSALRLHRYLRRDLRAAHRRAIVSLIHGLWCVLAANGRP